MRSVDPGKDEKTKAAKATARNKVKGWRKPKTAKERDEVAADLVALWREENGHAAPGA